MNIAFDGRAAQRAAHSYRRLLELFVMAAENVGLGFEIWTDGELHPECSTFGSHARAFPPGGRDTTADAVWTPTPSVVKVADVLCVSTLCDVNPLLPDGRNIVSRWLRARRFRACVSDLHAGSWRVATDSEDAQSRLVGEFPFCAETLKVVPLFAHPSLRRVDGPQRDALLSELGIKPGYVFFVGSFRRHKNWHGLMRAYAMCPESMRRAHPLVFSGPVHRDMQRANRLLASLGIAETVHILGETPERHMSALYSGADVFAFPTFMEGFGLPPLEAMQCGVPVIATNRTAVPEVLGEAPLYVDPADLSGLAVAMQEVLASRGLREKMAKDGLARSALFNAHRTGGAMLEILSGIDGAGRRG